jgi:hypothetical protein
MYLDNLRHFCRTLHFLPAIEIRAAIDDKIRELEQDQRLQVRQTGDYGEYVRALQRLRTYLFTSGIPAGTTEEEGEIFGEVVEKLLP